MSKRPIPTRAGTPRRTRRSRFISPPSNSSSYTTPNSNAVSMLALSSTPVLRKIDLLDDRLDAAAFSHIQLTWLQSHDTHRFNTCLDFARCGDSMIRYLLPSKFGGIYFCRYLLTTYFNIHLQFSRKVGVT